MISLGDTVMVVRWRHACPPAHPIMGVPKVVTGFQRGAVCPFCRLLIEEQSARLDERFGIPLSWLVKLKPLEEPVATSKGATA